MTPDWFRDLAQRCSDAADYAGAMRQPMSVDALVTAQRHAQFLAGDLPYFSPEDEPLLRFIERNLALDEGREERFWPGY